MCRQDDSRRKIGPRKADAQDDSGNNIIETDHTGWTTNIVRTSLGRHMGLCGGKSRSIDMDIYEKRGQPDLS